MRKRRPGVISSLLSALSIRRSRLFYRLYYRSQYYQRIGASRYLLRLFPTLHYVCFGTHENRNPNPFFDTEYYLSHNLDVVESGSNPLVHYLRYGAKERRNPSPFFDTGHYFDKYPDVSESGLNPLQHYLQHGAETVRTPNPLFENLRNVTEPNPGDYAQGRSWLQEGIGVSGLVGPPRQIQPQRSIRFEWDKGGWNNIRMQAEVMVGLAAQYDRALILPQPDQWTLISADEAHLFDYFDEDAFRAEVSVLPSVARVEDEWQVPEDLAAINTVRLKRATFQRQQGRECWYFPKRTRMFGCYSSVLGSDSSLYALVHRAFRIRTDLLDMAMELLQEHHLKPGGYLAAHVRRGDFQYPAMRHLSTFDIVDALRSHGADAAGKLLIVSDFYDGELLSACQKQGWETVCWATRHTSDPKLSGVLDMLCCCLGWRFVGTRLSTFSTGIIQWRGYVSRVEGAAVDAVPRFTSELDQVPWWARVDEHAWLTIESTGLASSGEEANGG